MTATAATASAAAAAVAGCCGRGWHLSGATIAHLALFAAVPGTCTAPGMPLAEVLTGLARLWSVEGRAALPNTSDHFAVACERPRPGPWRPPAARGGEMRPRDTARWLHSSG